MARDLSRLLRPKSIAVLGGAWANTVDTQCRRLGFAGPIYRVHPTREGDVWRSLSDLPEPPDAVFVGVNRAATVDILAEMKKIGAGGAVCFASGFSELNSAEGSALTNRLLAAADGVPFVGPNSYGIANFFDRSALFPDQLRIDPVDRGIAMIAQSGTISCNVMYADRTLPIGYLWNIGNQVDLQVHDLIEEAARDNRVSAIGLYVEHIPDPKAFAEATEFARTRGVPIALFRAGRSEAAKRSAQSHTGAMAGENRYFDALFSRLGVAACATLAELVETLKLLHVHGPLPSNAVIPMGASGGDMAMAADVMDPLDLTLPVIPSEVVTELKSQMGPRVVVSNPFDFQTFNWHDTDAMYAMFAAMMRAKLGIYAFLVDHPDPDAFEAALFAGAAQAFCRAAQSVGVPAVTISSMAESNRLQMRAMAMAHGVAPLQGMAEAFHAIENAAHIGQAWEAPNPPSLTPHNCDGPARILSEAQSKAALSATGIAFPKSVEVIIAEAGDAADRIGYPVVLKASCADLAHKTEAGGVILNLQDRDAVTAAAADLARLSPRVLVEEMIDDGVAELILGVTVDPDFGPIVVIGAGGILAELLKDNAILLPPFDRADVRAALEGLKIFQLLRGFRGKPAGDIEAVIAAALALGRFAASADTLLELDINPLIVRPAGRGAVAADALIRETTKGDTP
ncbi:MAG TPA: acetate--CoA ligase family protein [Roseovarius sp.]|nr:acetate--CoA ligase family protein [Roseovarius sp.]